MFIRLLRYLRWRLASPQQRYVMDGYPQFCHRCGAQLESYRFKRHFDPHTGAPTKVETFIFCPTPRCPRFVLYRWSEPYDPQEHACV